MQLLVWLGDSLFSLSLFNLVFVCLLECNRGLGPHTVMDSLLVLYHAAKSDLSDCCRGQEFFCSFNQFLVVWFGSWKKKVFF